MIRREESCGSSFFYGEYTVWRGEQSRGGLDKFWSKEVKLTKKDREGENMKK